MKAHPEKYENQNLIEMRRTLKKHYESQPCKPKECRDVAGVNVICSFIVESLQRVNFSKQPKRKNQHKPGTLHCTAEHCTDQKLSNACQSTSIKVYEVHIIN